MQKTIPIHSISVPNPFFEGQNSVHVIIDDPVTLIDSGIATDDAFSALQFGLQQHGLTVCDIARIVLTHKHVDHIGNAWRVQQASGASILIHATETRAVCDVPTTHATFLSQIGNRANAWHVPADLLPSVNRMRLPHWQLQSAACGALHDEQEIHFEHNSMRVLHTPGHTMGSICLQLGNRLFTGDHVLRDISPNVGAGDVDHHGMLALYLASLKKIADMDTGLDVLPGHGPPFRHLRARCKALLSHHEDRLSQILHILQQGAKTVFEVAIALFGSLTDFHVFLGCAEANAHLELLVDRERVRFAAGRYGLT